MGRAHVIRFATTNTALLLQCCCCTMQFIKGVTWTGLLGLAAMIYICAGNPMRSIIIQQFKKGYKNFAAEQGYKQVYAHPWLESEVLTVLQYMEHQLKLRSGMSAALLARDGFLLAVLWQIKSRGCNSGAWRLENIKLPTSEHLPVWICWVLDISWWLCRLFLCLMFY